MPPVVTPHQKIKNALDREFQHLEELVQQLPQVIMRELQPHLESIRIEIARVKKDLADFSLKKRTGHVNLQRTLARLLQALANMTQERDRALQSLREYEGRVQLTLAQIQQEHDGLLQQIQELKALIEPPRSYGTFVRLHEGENEQRRADIMLRGERLEVYVAGEVDLGTLRPGQRVLLTPQGNILKSLEEFEERGTKAIVGEILEDGRVKLETHLNEEVIAYPAGTIKDKKLQSGDTVLWDQRSNFITEVLPRSDASALLFEEIPDLTFADIGGQEGAIKKLRQFVEWPLVHRDKFQRYKAPLSAGVLLWGPPGNGKTLTLKALANEMRSRDRVKVYFLLVRGPELLNMFIGNTEAAIRSPFNLADAKIREEPEALIILFFDEIDALFPSRGMRFGDAGVSHTSVTQLATMLDGIRARANIIVAGTTNRPDMLDASLTRPGRLYPPIEFPRPNEDGVRQIFKVHLRDPEIPFHQKYFDPDHPNYESKYDLFAQDREKVLEYFLNAVIIRIFGDPNATQSEREKQLAKQRVVAIQYLDGARDQEAFYMKDLVSGAYCVAIVERAKLYAIAEEIATGQPSGLMLKHFYEALEEIFSEGESLPNRSNTQEWARMLGLPEARTFKVLPKAEREEEESRRTRHRRGHSGT